MAWVNVPKENHPLFEAALPKDRRIQTLKMFGSLAATVNGNMLGGLFARSVMVKLSPADQAEAMKLDGTEPFDPMGNGRVMTDSLLLPESVMDEPADLRDWLRRAFEHTVTLPAKKKKPAAKPKSAKPKSAPMKRAAKPAKKPKPATKKR